MPKGRPATPIEPGSKYALLTPIQRYGQDQHGRERWMCRCDCGQTTVVKATYLRTGEAKSCGCLKRVGYHRSHGHTEGGERTKAYTAWKNLRNRCDNPKNRMWPHYGGRGISYDPAWKSFDVFLADMGNPLPGQSIDRIDNDGSYCKANCRWTDRLTQRLNSRSPLRWVTVRGERMILADAVRKYSTVPIGIVASRLHRGWPEEQAILAPKTHRWARRGATVNQRKPA